MKKSKQAKTPKTSRKASASLPAADPELPNLITAMAKLVERLESVERKMDQVLGRVSSFPSEMRNVIQQSGRSNGAPSSGSGPTHPRPQTPATAAPRPAEISGNRAPQSQAPARRERPMYQAVCADCRKSCEIPFKPTEERPVYCKECFALRKSGRKSAPPLSPRSIASAYVNKKAGYPPPNPVSYRPAVSAPVSGNMAVLNSEKIKSAAVRHQNTRAKKKRK